MSTAPAVTEIAPCEDSGPKARFTDLVWLYLILFLASGFPNFIHMTLLIVAVGLAMFHFAWDYSRVWGPTRLGASPPEVSGAASVLGAAIGLMGLIVISLALIVFERLSGPPASWIVWLCPHLLIVLLATMFSTATRWLARNPANDGRLLNHISNLTMLVLAVHVVMNGVQARILCG